MENTPDVGAGFVACAERDRLLALSPFYSLSYHFGMLLGEEDFKTEQAYHRAKVRLHNAWLHREGVVWGFKVQIDDDDRKRGEIRVKSGLALDCAGRELHLEADACVNVASWYTKHEKDADFEIRRIGAYGGIEFDAHVVVRFKACLDRQVPALMEPCEGMGTETRYSRVFETVEVLLKPNQVPINEFPYLRLRLLFGLRLPKENEQDRQVVNEIKRIAGLPPAERPQASLAAFRRFAALDEMEMEPARSADGNERLLFPCGDDADEVVLANVTDIRLVKAGDEWEWVKDSGEVDNSVRPSHVATATLQELLSSGLTQKPPLEDEGARVDSDSVKFEEPRKISFTVTQDLDANSVDPDAFSVTSFSNAGWQKNDVVKAAFDGADKTVTLDLRDDLAGDFVRLIARGTGESPLMGTNGFPLAGPTDGPPASQHDGNDFVLMHKRR